MKKRKLVVLSPTDAEDLVSYADGETRVMRHLDIDFYELKEAALDQNIEKCPSCGWWVDSGELFNEEEIDGHCDNCR